MTRFTTMAALLGAAALGSTAAFAQTAPQTTPPAEQTTPPATTSTPPTAGTAAPGAAAASYTDSDVDQFAGAALAVQKIQQDAAVPDADKQTKMSAAVTSSGLTPEKFNAIATASQSDPALMKRIQTAAAAKMPASPSTAPTTGSSGGAGSTDAGGSATQ